MNDLFTNFCVSLQLTVVTECVGKIMSLLVLPVCF